MAVSFREIITGNTSTSQRLSSRNCHSFDVDKARARDHEHRVVVAGQTQIRFEEQGTALTAVEIGRDSRSPVVASLHRVLFAIGIVVSSYHVRNGSGGLVERFVLQRRDGGAIDGQLSVVTKAAILPIALQGEG